MILDRLRQLLRDSCLDGMGRKRLFQGNDEKERKERVCVRVRESRSETRLVTIRVEWVGLH